MTSWQNQYAAIKKRQQKTSEPWTPVVHLATFQELRRFDAFPISAWPASYTRSATSRDQQILIEPFCWWDAACVFSCYVWMGKGRVGGWGGITPWIFCCGDFLAFAWLLWGLGWVRRGKYLGNPWMLAFFGCRFSLSNSCFWTQQQNWSFT